MQIDRKYIGRYKWFMQTVNESEEWKREREQKENKREEQNWIEKYLRLYEPINQYILRNDEEQQ